MITKALTEGRKIVDLVGAKVAPVQWKHRSELRYWKYRKAAEGRLGNGHYEYFYTTHFGLTPESFTGKAILDVGCGPRGSLEWATMAARRVGLDPLVHDYLELGAKNHRMEYVDAPSEKMPFEDGLFDVVCCFNALDHVDDVKTTIGEIKRVTKRGGHFLLLVEINHPPTPTEPISLTTKIITDFEPEFSWRDPALYEPLEGRMYDSILHGKQLPRPEQSREPGWLSVHFEKR